MNHRVVIAAGALALGGCVAYPVYQPAPVARLTPAQSAALARPLDPAERDRIARDNAQVQRDDQADIAAQQQAYTYVYPSTPYYYGAPYPYYYGGFYPWAPALSLSFGYYRGWGGYRGGWHGGGWHGGGGGRRHR
jgi:hypothetical protein